MDAMAAAEAQSSAPVPAGAEVELPGKPAVCPQPGESSAIDMRNIRVYNVMGSTAGAGSGDFHTYRGFRRKEMIRLEKMEREYQDALKEKAFQERRQNRSLKEEIRTDKRRDKRKRKKAKKQAMKKSKRGGDGQGGGSDDEEGEAEVGDAAAAASAIDGDGGEAGAAEKEKIELSAAQMAVRSRAACAIAAMGYAC